MDKETVLLDFIKGEIMHGRNSNITSDENLLESGILDSLGILQLVAFVEKQFGLTIPDKDVVFENFSSIRVLSEYLEKLEGMNK